MAGLLLVGLPVRSTPEPKFFPVIHWFEDRMVLRTKAGTFFVAISVSVQRANAGPEILQCFFFSGEWKHMPWVSLKEPSGTEDFHMSMAHGTFFSIYWTSTFGGISSDFYTFL